MADFDPGENAHWRHGQQSIKPGEIVRHGDLGPWNWVFHEGELVGLIDWELATPGTKEEDIAQLTWYAIPLIFPTNFEITGIQNIATLQHRLCLCCEAFELTQDELHHGITAMIQREEADTERFAQAGIYPFTQFHENGAGLDQHLSNLDKIFARLSD